MRYLAIPFLFLALAVTGCQAPKQIANAVVQEFVDQATDLSVPSVQYRLEKGRWPKDYPELSEYVQQSGGQLRQYDQVKFTEFPDGRFQIYSVAGANTNLMTFNYKFEEKK
jgi:hypothetical protein